MNWIINLLGSRLGPWIVLGFLGVWSGSLAGTYLQGRADGKAAVEAKYESLENQRLSSSLSVLQEHLEKVLKGQEIQARQNKELAETLENKIHNKEVIVKEKLREVPIEVAADCSIDYNAVRVHNIIADPAGDN